MSEQGKGRVSKVEIGEKIKTVKTAERACKRTRMYDKATGINVHTCSGK